MAQDVIDYEAVIADLEVKRAALDSVISSLRQLLNSGALIAAGGGGGVVAGKPVDPSSIRDDAFFGLSIGDAAKRYLEMVSAVIQ